MTVAEFFGCAFLAFGAPLAMFIFTIAHDPMRIIILIVAAFVWLLSLLVSSVFWYAIIPLRDILAFGLIFSVIFQEIFRFLIYKIIRKTEISLQEIANSVNVTENKLTLAYVSGFGFGIISGAFAFINVLADAVGPATMGLKSGSDIFFITSAAQTLCMILLHTFWGVIFFHACDNSKIVNIAFVIISHLVVSSLTLLNSKEYYFASLFPIHVITVVTSFIALKVAGRSCLTIKKFITCQ